MDRLTDPEYWESIYAPVSAVPTSSGWFTTRLKRLLGPVVLQYMADYPSYLLWDVVLPTFLRRQDGAKALEVGSAPGFNLIRLHDAFGFEPFGVEYSRSGVELNRKRFELEGITADNVIHADFLSAPFQERYKSRFDVVVSFGFIEHFSDVEDVVSKHLNVLSPGGCLVVTIPNLRGFNYFLSWVFQKDVIPLHNLSIMRKQTFCALFDGLSVTSLMCRYYGTFNFGLFNTSSASWKRHLLNVCGKVQKLLNVLFRVLFGPRGAECAYFSPYLIFVGVKKG